MNVKREFVSVGKGVVSLCAALAVAGVLFLPGKGMAQIINMDDNGSQASVNLGSQAGMYNWSVNGQNQLIQQWFWYQTGGGVAQSIDTIGTPSVSTSTGSSGIDVLSATYQNAQLSLTIQYVLSGGGVGSGQADMLESISIQNVSSSALNLNFYEYSHFNLLGTGNNSVQLFGSGGTFSAVRQSNGATAIQEAIVSPFANYGETALASSTLNSLNTIPGYVLNDNASAGPGDVTWAFQWVQNDLAPGAMFDVFKDKSLSIGPVPEPSTLALIALGLGAWGMARRRHSS